ncbi:hypothetical protein HDU98_005324 [Podochytrium sp. JEL0797]|nr:hypothetical protein HDU98_005324 [Podochytrium sp. JEL0797]
MTADPDPDAIQASAPPRTASVGTGRRRRRLGNLGSPTGAIEALAAGDSDWEDANAVARKFRWAKAKTEGADIWHTSEHEIATGKLIMAGNPLLPLSDIPIVSHEVLLNTQKNIVVGRMSEASAAALIPQKKPIANRPKKSVRFLHDALGENASRRPRPKRASSHTHSQHEPSSPENDQLSSPSAIPVISRPHPLANTIRDRKRLAGVSRFHSNYAYEVALANADATPLLSQTKSSLQPVKNLALSKAASSKMISLTIIPDPEPAASPATSVTPTNSAPIVPPKPEQSAMDSDWEFDEPEVDQLSSSNSRRRPPSSRGGSGNGRSKTPVIRQPLPTSVKVIKPLLKDRMLQKLELQKAKLLAANSDATKQLGLLTGKAKSTVKALFAGSVAGGGGAGGSGAIGTSKLEVKPQEVVDPTPASNGDAILDLYANSLDEMFPEFKNAGKPATPPVPLTNEFPMVQVQPVHSLPSPSAIPAGFVPGQPAPPPIRQGSDGSKPPQFSPHPSPVATTHPRPPVVPALLHMNQPAHASPTSKVAPRVRPPRARSLVSTGLSASPKPLATPSEPLPPVPQLQRDTPPSPVVATSIWTSLSRSKKSPIAAVESVSYGGVSTVEKTRVSSVGPSRSSPNPAVVVAPPSVGGVVGGSVDALPSVVGALGGSVVVPAPDSAAALTDDDFLVQDDILGFYQKDLENEGVKKEGKATWIGWMFGGKPAVVAANEKEEEGKK